MLIPGSSGSQCPVPGVVPGGSLVPATVLSGQPRHEKLRVTAFDVDQELRRNGTTQCGCPPTVMRDDHVITLDVVVESSRWWHTVILTGIPTLCVAVRHPGSTEAPRAHMPESLTNIVYS